MVTVTPMPPYAVRDFVGTVAQAVAQGTMTKERATQLLNEQLATQPAKETAAIGMLTEAKAAVQMITPKVGASPAETYATAQAALTAAKKKVTAVTFVTPAPTPTPTPTPKEEAPNWLPLAALAALAYLLSKG